MSAQLRKRLAQGASKKAKPARSRGGNSGAASVGGGHRQREEESVNIHSESQRLVRGRSKSSQKCIEHSKTKESIIVQMKLLSK